MSVRSVAVRCCVRTQKDVLGDLRERRFGRGLQERLYVDDIGVRRPPQRQVDGLEQWQPRSADHREVGQHQRQQQRRGARMGGAQLAEQLLTRLKQVVARLGVQVRNL